MHSRSLSVALCLFCALLPRSSANSACTPPLHDPTDLCDLAAPLDLARAFFAPATDENTFLSSPNEACLQLEEDCICAALRMGWSDTALYFLSDRWASKVSSSRLRILADQQEQAGKMFLARLHPRWPRHVKTVPAMVWVQNDTMVQVRIRFSKFIEASPDCLSVENVQLRVTERELYFSAEGGEKPLFFETSVRLSGALQPGSGRGAEGGEEGEAAVDVAWAVRKGELVLEARKAESGKWGSLFDQESTKIHKAHTIVANRREGLSDRSLEKGMLITTLGPLLGCTEDCVAEGQASWEECRQGCASETCWLHSEAPFKSTLTLRLLPEWKPDDCDSLFKKKDEQPKPWQVDVCSNGLELSTVEAAIPVPAVYIERVVRFQTSCKKHSDTACTEYEAQNRHPVTGKPDRWAQVMLLGLNASALGILQRAVAEAHPEWEVSL